MPLIECASAKRCAEASVRELTAVTSAFSTSAKSSAISLDTVPVPAMPQRRPPPSRPVIDASAGSLRSSRTGAAGAASASFDPRVRDALNEVPLEEEEQDDDGHDHDNGAREEQSVIRAVRPDREEGKGDGEG